MRIAWLWFGSWKNGLTNFAPAWVVANQDRFPRAQLAGGKTVEVLSTLSDANRDADAKAFAAFMRHIKEGDSPARTTIMVQLENEVGLIGDSRDRSALANEAFAKPVPKELTDYLQAHKDSLLPETLKVWGAAGAKTSGTWEQVFGAGKAKADEVFMAWNYSRYIGKVAEAGKAEYPVPMYVNAWIVQPEDKGPGDYPSGGPQDHMHDIWRAGGPQIDMLSPDIYLPNFNELADRYSRKRQPAVHSGIVRHRGRRGQRVLRHRAAQRHRLLAHGHRSARSGCSVSGREPEPRWRRPRTSRTSRSPGPTRFWPSSAR